MSEPTKKQEEALREFLHSAVVPLIEDVLVKKLGQAMSYAKEQLNQPKRVWQGLTDEECIEANYPDGYENGVTVSDLDCYVLILARQVEAKLKEKNT